MKSVKSDGIWTIYGTSTEEKPDRDAIQKLYDDKPVVFFEMDTQNVYMYDYETDQWILQ